MRCAELLGSPQTGYTGNIILRYLFAAGAAQDRYVKKAAQSTLPEVTTRSQGPWASVAWLDLWLFLLSMAVGSPPRSVLLLQAPLGPARRLLYLRSGKTRPRLSCGRRSIRIPVSPANGREVAGHHCRAGQWPCENSAHLCSRFYPLCVLRATACCNHRSATPLSLCSPACWSYPLSLHPCAQSPGPCPRLLQQKQYQEPHQRVLAEARVILMAGTAAGEREHGFYSASCLPHRILNGLPHTQ